MSDFTDNVRKAFELYLFGHKKEALAHLLPGSKYHSYLTIIDAMKREKSKLTKETQEMISKFLETNYGTEAEKVRMTKLFLDYEGAKNDVDRKKAIDTLSSHVGAYYGHTKPIDLARKTHKKKGEEEKKGPRHTKEAFDTLFQVKSMLANAQTSGSYYLQSLHKSLYNEMDFSKVTNDEFMNFVRNATAIGDITCKSFTAKFATYVSDKHKENQYFNLEYYLLDKLTIEQMEAIEKNCTLLKSDENWIGKIFEKKFHYELDDEAKDNFTIEERREQLIRMYDASKNRPQSLKSALLLEILENGMKLDIYDRKYFLDYLKSPLKTWHLNPDKAKYENYSYSWAQYMPNIQNRKGGQVSFDLDEKLYKTYLEQFYRDKNGIKEFLPYFEATFIKNFLEELDFFSGKEIKSDSLNATRFEDLRDKVLIELLDCNKELFKKEDRVQIVAELKNTPQIFVKIYEFERKTELSGCSDEYYQKNLTPFSTDINLDGLKTQDEKVYEFDEPPQKKFRQVFNFPELDDRVGLFVIEFISNGFSSRAVIKKGSLSLITKATVAGHIAYVLDENKDICKGDDAGLWFQGKFYKADPEKNGKIVIHYEKSSATDKAILVNNGFAQLAEFCRMTENYSLDVAYLLENETLLMGNEAKILLRPVLKVNDRICTLKALKNTIIKVTTMSFIDHIPVTKIFEDPVLTDHNEIVLNFQVPPNLESVTINFETKVRNISHQRLDSLSSSHSIYMKTHSSDFEYHEDYLRKQNGEYFYYVLGKNGEPIEDHSVLVSLTNALQPNSPNSVQTVTDKEGKIALGKLDNIITARFNNNEWTLPQKSQTC